MTRDNNNTNWLPWTKLLVGTFVGLLAAGGGVSAWLGVCAAERKELGLIGI